MQTINCKLIREMILEDVRKHVAKMRRVPHLTIIQVIGDDASEVYIRNKVKTCGEVGIECAVIKLANDVPAQAVMSTILGCVSSPQIDAVMLQCPLPDHLKEHEREFLDLIPFYKDADGLSSESVGRLWSDLPCVVPATAAGVMRLLPRDLRGKDVTVINRSALIGKPLLKLLLDRNATVTMCHSKTNDLEIKTSVSDIVISGVGIPKFFDKEYVVKDVMWIDCGITRDKDGKLCGDLDLEGVSGIRGLATSVPGGVGLLTTAQLAMNVVTCYGLAHGGEVWKR